MSRPNPLRRDPPRSPQARVVITWSGLDRTDITTTATRIDPFAPPDATTTTKDARPGRAVTMVVTVTRMPEERTSVIEVRVHTPDATPWFAPDVQSDSRSSDDSLDDRDEHFTEVPLLPTAEGRRRPKHRPSSHPKAPASLALERPDGRTPWLTLRHVACGTPKTRRVAAVLGAVVAVLCTIAVLGRPSNRDAVVASPRVPTTTTFAVGVHYTDAATSASTFARSACESLSGPGWIGGLYINAAAPATHTPGTTDTAFSPADCLPTPPQECLPGSPPSRGDG
jgi:hypothetical protein